MHFDVTLLIRYSTLIYLRVFHSRLFFYMPLIHISFIQ